MSADSDVLLEYLSFSAEAKSVNMKHNSSGHPFSKKWVVYSVKPTV